MRNNKMKGFTLVELLVVIAILAILATVSVVGYTSYIEGATVRVDEDLAAQLTRFLEAYKVNNPGEITEDNIWQITQDILEESGVNELNPKAQQYGYHFYFDLAEGKYVLKNDTDVLSPLAVRLYNLLANAEDGTFEARPGSFFTTDNRYFLVDTAGSDLADVVRAFYTAEDTTDFIKNLNEKVSKLTVSGFSTLISNATFVTKDGNLGSGTGMIYVHDNAGSIEIPANTITPAETDRIIIPEGVSITSLGIAADKAVTVYIEADSWNEVKKLVDPGFVSDKVTVVLGGDNTKYTVVDDAKVYKSDDYATNGENATVVASLTYNNPVHEFDIEIDHDFATNDLTDKDALKGYIAYDRIGENGIQLKVSNEKGKLQMTDPTNPYKISYPVYTWAITKVLLGDDSVVTDDPDTDACETDAYATIDPATGILTLADDYDFGVKYIEVKATAVLGADGNLPAADGTYTVAPTSQTFEVHVASVSSVGFELAGKTWLWTGEEELVKATLIHSGNNIYNMYNTLGYTNNLDGIVLDDTVSVTYDENATAAEKALVTIATATADDTKYHTITTNAGGKVMLDVKIGPYKAYKIELTVVDLTSDLALKAKNTNIKYIGNSNEIKLSDLFTGNLPANAQVIVFNNVPVNDTNFMDPSNSRGLALINDGSRGAYVECDDGSYMYVNTTDNKLHPQNGKAVTTLEGTTIKIAGVTDSTKLTFAIFSNGVRISPDVSVEVVNGLNIRDFTELTSTTNMSNTFHTLKDSIVLLNNITFPGANDYITTKAGSIDENGVVTYSYVYGNYFTIDVTAGVKSGHYGFINLAKYTYMRDIRIIGSVFETLQLSGGSDYGTNVVGAADGVVIDNCYLANCRAPLCVNGSSATATVELKNSVLYGGRFGNVEIKNGTLKLTGDKVVMVNQPHKDITKENAAEIVGVGIVTWLEAGNGSGVDASACKEFVQYNFIAQDKTGILPTVYIEFTDSIKNRLTGIIGKGADYLIKIMEAVDLLQTVDYDNDGEDELCLELKLSDYFSDIFTAKKSMFSSELKYKDFHFTKEETKYVAPTILAMFKNVVFEQSDYDTAGVDSTTKYGTTSYSLDLVGLLKMNIAGLKEGYKIADGTYPNRELLAESATEAQRYSPWTEGGNNGYTFVGNSIVYEVTE